MSFIYNPTTTVATNLQGGIASQIPYQTDANTTAFIANGTSGQYLKSNGTSAPSWVTPAAGGVTWITKTTTYTAATGDNILVDTSSAAFTITLPATPSTGNNVYFQDAKGTFATNNLTIGRNGSTIMGVSEDMTVSINNQGFGLIYNGSDWRVF
jgi:hypothetical protein